MVTTNKIKLGVIVSLVLVVAYKLHGCNKPVTTSVSSTANVKPLKPNESDRVTYNSNTHQVTEVKSNGTITKEYARNPVITVEKSGLVNIQRNDWGWEHEPFIGMAMHETPRVHLGISIFYYNKFDLNLSLALTTASNYGINDVARGAFTVSYNVWNNTNLFAGIDTHKVPCGGIYLRW